MGKQKITEDDYKEIISMIKDGYKYRVIGEKFGIDESRVRQIKKKEGIEIKSKRLSRTFNASGKAYTEENITEICNMYSNGVSIAKLAKLYDATNWCQIYGILKVRNMLDEKSLPEDLEKDIIRLYELGIRLSLICQIISRVKGLDISYQKVSACLRRNGIDTKKYIPQKNIHIRQKIWNLYNDFHLSIDDISVITQKSHQAVRKLLRDYKNTKGLTD